MLDDECVITVDGKRRWLHCIVSYAGNGVFPRHISANVFVSFFSFMIEWHQHTDGSCIILTISTHQSEEQPHRSCVLCRSVNDNVLCHLKGFSKGIVNACGFLSATWVYSDGGIGEGCT